MILRSFPPQSDADDRARRKLRFRFSGRRGFSLIELLTVTAIIVLVASFSTSALRGLAGGDNLQSAVIGISSTLEAARQAAIASGSYTWVAMSEERDPNADQPAVVVAAFTSKVGTRGADFRNGADMRLLSKVVKYDGVTLMTEPPGGSSLASQLPKVHSKHSPSDSNFKPQSDDLPGPYRNVAFDWVVIFNPRGEAGIDSDSGMQNADSDSIDLAEAVEFTVVSSKGDNPSSKEEKSAVTIRVNGLTGQVDVYQAEVRK